MLVFLDFERTIILQNEFEALCTSLGELNERTTSRQYRSGAVVWQLFSKSINQVNTHAGIQLFLEVNNRRGFFQDYIPIP